MINPTVSRMVWYRPGPRDCAGGENPIPQIDAASPLHSMICGVLGPGRVNLAVFGADGSGPYPRVDVALVQDDYEVQPGQCSWMPYQKGQAAAQTSTPAIGAAGAAVVSAETVAAQVEQHVATAADTVKAGLEAKGKEIHDLLTGVEQRVKDFLAEGHDKLIAAATHVENVVKQAMTGQAAPPANPEPPAPQG